MSATRKRPRRKLVTSSESVQSARQHRKPCCDCPWSREALRGWLGSDTPEQWLRAAHGETRIPCHVINNQQCAGTAIYRANVCKVPHDPTQLSLPADRDSVFATPMEFLEHHKSGPMK